MAETPGRDPRTIVRPPGAAAAGRADVFAGLAGPLLALAASAARDPRPNAAALAAEVRRRAEAFETAALRAGVPRDQVGEARDALLAVFEARVTGNPALPADRWAAARRKALPGVAEPDAAALAGRRAAAERAGGARRDLARFLRHCEEAVGAAPAPREGRGVRWGFVVPVVLLLGLVAWAGWVEWRYSARLLAGMPGPEAVAAAGSGGPAAAARELDLVAAAAAEVAAGAADSPVGLAGRLGRFGPAAAAGRRYAAAVDALMPGPLGEALAAAFATEGGSLPLYDALRTLAILDGEAPWQPGFVAGWLAARGAEDPALARLAPHAGALSGPPAGLAAPDAELVAQARGIAAEGDPAEFAFLELARDPGIRALAGWSPAEVPDLATVVVRRSGRPLGQAIPGLFTAAGWAAASGGGARAAIERASAEGARVIGAGPAAPVGEAALLEVLQARTLDAWAAELADLRVKPFTDQPGSVLISGTLGRSGSPLEALFRAVWREVGGEDRGRSHLNRLRAAAAFGPMIQFVEQGHMAEVARLFAGLNVALQALDADAEVGRRRLMDVQARATSIATLNQAPRLVVQIVEDVLAQTAATQSGLLKPRAALAWQRDYAGACRFAIAERYPFAGGPDADLRAVADFLGPQGSLARFFAAEVAPLVDASESPWRWKPEARLEGFSPESATFFERALAVGDALFPSDGAPVTLTLTALAQRGAATVSVGGTPEPVTTAGEPARFDWPGREPGAGLEVAFAGGDGVERQAWAGPWGLLRFLDGLRLRARDDGQRYLLDVRVNGARGYMEMAFARPANPAAARAAMRGLGCPAAL